MKKITLAMAAILAASSALAPVSAQAHWFQYSIEKSVEKSKKGGLIVRNIWSDKPLGTCGTTMCDKPEDVFAGLCLGMAYKKAGSEEKRRIQDVLSRNADYLAAMDVGLFITDTAGVIAKKGSVKVGDEITLRAIPLLEALPEVTNLNCVEPKHTVFVVDKILKHHDGTILYSNGHMLGGAPSNDKPASKPAPKKTPSFLD